MQNDSEVRKEIKDNSTGVSNEIHEVAFSFHNEQNPEFSKKEKTELTSPKFDVVNPNDDFILCYEKSNPISLPEKFLNLTPESLACSIKSLFRGLPTELQSKLWKQLFPHFQQTIEKMHETIEKTPDFLRNCQKFINMFKTGQFDKAFHEEVKISRQLDNHFYSALVSKNYIQACQNYSNREIIEKNDNNGLNISDSTGVHGITREEVDLYSLHSDTSFDSIYCEIQYPENGQKSVSIEFSERESRTKKQSKKMITNIPKSTTDDIRNFQVQEIERYASPTYSYIYRLKSGESRWVAPVCKKLVESSIRPREHFLLVSDRPLSVTILSLVRDAAAKLPKGFGTRTDICELLKESQFINPDVEEDKMSSVVSGALDRLHYENDPCVKFDTNKKLWIYLHIGRQEITANSSEKESSANVKVEKSRSKKIKIN